jgi:hypothetical protein
MSLRHAFLVYVGREIIKLAGRLCRQPGASAEGAIWGTTNAGDFGRAPSPGGIKAHHPMTGENKLVTTHIHDFGKAVAMPPKQMPKRKNKPKGPQQVLALRVSDSSTAITLLPAQLILCDTRRAAVVAANGAALQLRARTTRGQQENILHQSGETGNEPPPVLDVVP